MQIKTATESLKGKQLKICNIFCLIYHQNVSRKYGQKKKINQNLINFLQSNIIDSTQIR